jgi:hypothetical protein
MKKKSVILTLFLLLFLFCSKREEELPTKCHIKNSEQIIKAQKKQIINTEKYFQNLYAFLKDDFERDIITADYIGWVKTGKKSEATKLYDPNACEEEKNSREYNRIYLQPIEIYLENAIYKSPEFSDFTIDKLQIPMDEDIPYYKIEEDKRYFMYIFHLRFDRIYFITTEYLLIDEDTKKYDGVYPWFTNKSIDEIADMIKEAVSTVRHYRDVRYEEYKITEEEADECKISEDNNNIIGRCGGESVYILKNAGFGNDLTDIVYLEKAYCFYYKLKRISEIRNMKYFVFDAIRREGGIR